MTELRELAKPFPSSLVERAPGGFGDFVTWSVKVEKLLATVGPFDWCIVREITDPDGTITGAVGRLTVTVDGVTVRSRVPAMLSGRTFSPITAPA